MILIIIFIIMIIFIIIVAIIIFVIAIAIIISSYSMLLTFISFYHSVLYLWIYRIFFIFKHMTWLSIVQGSQ